MSNSFFTVFFGIVATCVAVAFISTSSADDFNDQTIDLTVPVEPNYLGREHILRIPRYTGQQGTLSHVEVVYRGISHSEWGFENLSNVELGSQQFTVGTIQMLFLKTPQEGIRVVDGIQNWENWFEPFVPEFDGIFDYGPGTPENPHVGSGYWGPSDPVNPDIVGNNTFTSSEAFYDGTAKLIYRPLDYATGWNWPNGHLYPWETNTSAGVRIRVIFHTN